MVEGMRAAACSLVLMTTLLPACLEQGRPFEAVAAPQWHPGYTWTYSSEVQTNGAMGQDGAEAHQRATASLTLSVINTTTPYHDEAVYYLVASGTAREGADHPLVHGDVTALRQSDLQVAAAGWTMLYAVAEPTEPGDLASAIAECEAPATLEPVEPAERFPQPRFPIQADDEWSGFIGEDGERISYTVKTLGWETISTAAGSFRAVKVVAEFEESEADGDFRFLGGRSETWYAPDVRNWVQSTVEVAAEFEGQPLTFSSNIELREFSLEPGPASPAPIPRDEAAARSIQFSLYTTDALPLDLSSGPVTLDLAAGPSLDVAQPTLTTVTQFPPLELPDDVAVTWTLRDAQYNAVDRAQGAQVSFPIDRPGSYAVEALLSSEPCAAFQSYQTAFAEIPTFWSRTWEVEIDPGTPATIDVDDFYVGLGVHSSTVDWEFQREHPPAADGGKPILRAPDGRDVQVRETGRGFEFDLFPPGQWHLSWVPEGEELLVMDSPILVGDDVTVTLAVQYGYIPPPFPY